MKVRLAPLIMAGLFSITFAPSARAQVAQFSGSFEGSTDNWTPVGHAGFDLSQGYARTGVNNGWIRNHEGWNALQSTGAVVSLQAGYLWTCTASAYLRSSGNVSSLYMSALTYGGSIIAEVGPKSGSEIGVWPNYQYLGFTFIVDNRPRMRFDPSIKSWLPRPPASVRFRVGFWGNGQDAWVQVDDVNVSCTGSNYTYQ